MKARRLGLALSGGGLRATLFHLGMVRLLHECGLLSRVTHISSVSGGAVLAAHLHRRWHRYLEDFDGAAAEMIAFAQRDVRGRIGRRMPLIVLGSKFSRTARLEREFENLYRTTAETPRVAGGAAPKPHVYYVTTNLSTGKPCAFDERGFYVDDPDEPEHHGTPKPSLACKVAMSAAFPAFFPPVPLTAEAAGIDKQVFKSAQHFTDGGVFDNLGVLRFDRLFAAAATYAPAGSPEATSEASGLPELVLVSDASGRFDYDELQRAGALRTVFRAVDILMNRADATRKRAAGTGDRWHGLASCVHIDIATRLSEKDDEFALDYSLSRHVARIRTDLDAFSRFEISALVMHGYCVARQALRQHAPETPLPEGAAWDPFDLEAHDDERPVANRARGERVEQRRNRQDHWLTRSAGRRLRLFSRQDPLLSVFVVALLLIAAAITVGAGYLGYEAIVERLSTPEQLADRFDHLKGGQQQAFVEAAKLEMPPLSSALTRIRNVGEVRVRMSASRPGGWFVYPAGTGYRGLDVRVATELVKGLKDKLDLDEAPVPVFSTVPWEQLLASLREGAADIVISSISYRPEREKHHGIRFSIPYYRTRLAIVGRDLGPEADLETLLGKRKVGVHDATTAELFLEHLKETRRTPEIEIVRHTTIADAAQDLERGDLDLILVDNPYADVVVVESESWEGGPVTARKLRDGDFDRWRGEHHRRELYVVGVARFEDELAWAVNEVILDLTQDGRIEAWAQAERTEYLDHLRGSRQDR